jgi:hypothetical protein
MRSTSETRWLKKNNLLVDLTGGEDSERQRENAGEIGSYKKGIRLSGVLPG